MKWQQRPLPAAPWGWAGTGLLLGAAVATLCFAPARWLAGALAQASGQRVLLHDAQGTVWQGSAQLVLGAGAGTQDRAQLPGRIRWQLGGGAGGAELRVRADCCMDSAWAWRLAPGWNGLQAYSDDLTAPLRLPSSLLSGLGTPWNTLQLQGTLALRTQGLVLRQQGGRWDMEGSAQLDAQHMSTSLATLRPIGSYSFTLQGGATPTLALRTQDGSSLQLQGQGRWVGGRLQFDGVALAAPERAEALANLLNIIGRRDGARSIIKVG